MAGDLAGLAGVRAASVELTHLRKMKALILTTEDARATIDSIVPAMLAYISGAELSKRDLCNLKSSATNASRNR